MNYRCFLWNFPSTNSEKLWWQKNTFQKPDLQTISLIATYCHSCNILPLNPPVMQTSSVSHCRMMAASSSCEDLWHPRSATRTTMAHVCCTKNHPHSCALKWFSMFFDCHSSHASNPMYLCCFTISRAGVYVNMTRLYIYLCVCVFIYLSIYLLISITMQCTCICTVCIKMFCSHLYRRRKWNDHRR